MRRSFCYWKLRLGTNHDVVEPRAREGCKMGKKNSVFALKMGAVGQENLEIMTKDAVLCDRSRE